MAVELRPLGVKCNIQCQYCYQNPQRDAGNVSQEYDIEEMKKAVEAEGGPFSLFGGEPLLLPLPDLEKLWAWGQERYGHNSMQTNGARITDEHIDLIKRYKVHVGVSIDGPGELNDARWAGSLEHTRATTAKVEAVIERLCREGLTPTLIITLHRGNASPEKLPVMREWFKKLEATGIKSARLHLLEVDHEDVRAAHAMTAEENLQAVRMFADLEPELRTLKLDLFDDVRRLLAGSDDGITCVWGACDPYTTSAVRGVEGHGQRSNCGRTNKDGVDFVKADQEGFERYLALYHTPQTHGGCQGCRFFIFCKGQCPGTGIDNDWRNRSEHCGAWMEVFERAERSMIQAGKEPLSQSPLRGQVEALFIAAWERGHNTSLEHSLRLLREDAARKDAPAAARPAMPEGASAETEIFPRAAFTLPPFTRVAWTSDATSQVWAPRFERLRTLGGELEWRAVAGGVKPCAVVTWPESSTAAEPWSDAGLEAVRLDAARAVVGLPENLELFCAAMESGDTQAMSRLLGRPECCDALLNRCSEHALLDSTWMTASATASASADRVIHTLGSAQANNLLRTLGIRTVTHTPCRFDCAATVAMADRVDEIAREAGFATEMDWLGEILSWPVEWSALHGIAEIRTPVVKLSTRTDATLHRHTVRMAWHSAGFPTEGARGVRFPYLAPKLPKLTVSAGFKRGIEHTLAKTRTTQLADGVIHRESLQALRGEGRLAGRRLRGVHVTSYFVIAELDDGSVGAGMSYFQNGVVLSRLLPAATDSDPLLLAWLFDDDAKALSQLGGDSADARHFLRAVRTAALSALTSSLLDSGGSAKFKVSETVPADPFAKVSSAVVVGFGGYLHTLAEAPQIRHVHVCDLGYPAKRESMEARLEGYRKKDPAKRFTLSNGLDAEAQIQATEALAVTGSALCNGSMEQLLGYAKNGQVVVVQGQSAGIHPQPFFDRGVRMVTTTRKPGALAALAAGDLTGAALLPYFEGGLPWIYLTPA